MPNSQQTTRGRSPAPTPTPSTQSSQTVHHVHHVPTATASGGRPVVVTGSGGRGRSVMGDIAANAASTAAGVVGAHAVMNALGMEGGHRGGGGGEAAPASYEQPSYPQQPPPQYQEPDYQQPYQQSQYQQQAPITSAEDEKVIQGCRNHYSTLMRCMESNTSNISNCQWALDLFNKCKQESGANANEKYL
jgi:hypothetical protein